MPVKDLYYQKYLKYKNKYINLQSQMGGGVRYTGDSDDIKTFTSLKQKLRLDESTTKEAMFISVPIIVYHPGYLDYNEIIMLANIFKENSSTPSSIALIKYMTESSEPLVGEANVPLKFKLEEIKNFIILPFQYYIKFNFNNIYINDNQLHFELLFIFECILLTNKQTDALFNSDFSFLSIDLKIYQKSFNRIIEGLTLNIIIKLTINSCMISDEEAKAIATALTDNTNLEVLYLNENKIGVEGAKAIAQVLETNKTLKLRILGLNKNNIGDEGVKAIAQVLEKNTIFDSLYLNENIIGDEGAKAIAHELERNTTLRNLQLSMNKIGMKGATALVTALIQNTTLIVLDLVMPDITDEQYKILKKIIDDDPNERLVLRVKQ